MLRSLIERLSRDQVIRRRLPPDLGGHTLLVSPDSAARFWRRDLSQVDPLLLQLARESVVPGGTVWDIGANVGLFAAAASFLAGRSGKVLAVEADGWLAGLLRRSAATLPADQAPIEVLSIAVAERNGIAELCIASRGRAANHLASTPGSTQAGGVRAVQKVVTVTLDWLLDWFPAPDLVKLDVEGAELDCLRGGSILLGRRQPEVICEVARENAAEVGRLLHGHGYTLYDAASPAGDRIPLAAPTWNTIALPPGAPATWGDPISRRPVPSRRTLETHTE